MKELEGKIRELGEAESVEREALKEEISLHIEQKVGHLASEVSSAWTYSGIRFMIQVKSRVDLITRQMESDQAWTKNRLDDMGRLLTIVNVQKLSEIVEWYILLTTMLSDEDIGEKLDSTRWPYNTGCFFNWYPPKKLKYGKPSLGESTAT